MKVLIVDDEPLAREGLEQLLRNYPQVESVSAARHGMEAVAMIRSQKPDLVFLDIQMPRMDGFAVVEAVGPEQMPAVIFVTAHDRYATRAFDISAVDYLLKPVTEDRFRLAFQRVTSRPRPTSLHDVTEQMRAMLGAIAHPRRHLTRLAIRTGERTLFLAVNDVDRIEAAENYVRLHAGPSSHLLHVPMNTIESALDPEHFVRIHRSHIVNIQRIKQLWPLAHGQYVVELLSGIRLQSGRTYGERIRGLLSNPF